MEVLGCQVLGTTRILTQVQVLVEMLVEVLAELVAVVQSHAANFALKFEGLEQLGLGDGVGPNKVRTWTYWQRDSKSLKVGGLLRVCVF